MNLPFKIALRFLFHSVRSRPVTLFTTISILGIACSVMLFLLVNTLINGLTINLRTTLLGFEAPLFVDVTSQNSATIKDELMAFSAQNKKTSFQFVSTSQFDGLVHVLGQAPLGIRVRSVSANFFDIKKDDMQIVWFDGYSAESFAQRDNVVLVGADIYERLRFLPGEEEIATVTHPFADVGPSGDIEPVEKEFKVAGLFATGRTDFDDVYILISNLAMDHLANPSFQESSYFLYPTRINDTNNIKEKLNKIFLSQHVFGKTWLDKNKNIFKAMQLEKLMYYIVFLFVMLISCFNLVGVVAIFGMGKARETAILKSLGLMPHQVKKVFLSLGIILGTLGGILGVIFGLCIVCLFQKTHISLPEAYGFTEFPLVVNYVTVAILLLGTPIIAAVISWIPSSKLARDSINDILRMS